MTNSSSQVGQVCLGFLSLALLALLFSGCNDGAATSTSASTTAVDDVSTGNAPSAGGDGETSIRSLVASEELILQLAPRMQLLSQSALNLSIPDFKSRGLFGDAVHVVDLDGARAEEEVPKSLPLGLHAMSWSVDDQEQIESNQEVELWSPLLSTVDYFEDAKFYLIDGRFAGDDLTTFDSRVGFAGLARLSDGLYVSVKAEMDVRWKHQPLADDGNLSESRNPWAIARWAVKQLHTVTGDHLFFRDVRDEAIPDMRLRAALTESKHWQIAQRHYYPQLKAKLPDTVTDDRFFPISTANHPGLSVVDIDQDGDDDLYVTVRWGQNHLLRNQGDGTFEDIAATLGLNVDGRSNGAVFCDFDNDGDKDLMLARSLERSAYLVNEHGKFVDRTKDLVDGALPFEATSVSAVDYNGDGLLDVYFATYHQDDVSRQADADLSNPQHRIHRYLSASQSEELKRRFRQQQRPFVDQVGPPNILLVNRGGRFEIAPESDRVAVWRNSFQATWCDFDQDGDPDLYVANDFAPDCFFQNNGPNGFQEVTVDVGIDKIGFAMGVSWGDYDNNGTDDLYISNMYSKAGRRITRQVAGLDERISLLATGNYLYSNDQGRFKMVSSLESKEFPVAVAGWAWGGQFADLDNDGFLDIYVSSGYYTAPDEFKTDVDL